MLVSALKVMYICVCFMGGLLQVNATPLHWLPTNCSAAAVRILVDRGAEINVIDNVR
jgi:hypothetical protein